jgi:hypothetical protein
MIHVNIPRPIPNTNENAEQIKYLEPLIESNDVFVNSAFRWNKAQYDNNQECSYSPGYRYEFWFRHIDTAEEFVKLFNGEVIDYEFHY